ncbi:UvrD-helicase domain-containing protein [Neobacillus sp. YIM B02564]|jgi:DNA helicase-2/ATP-dependent DNA helicase PcrA|uniref:DNA 3'-5' helicase n=1 Tax=Neobacillus paridis TaxID=2803862 RepID=A0ABS1TPS9_9BACI|nr:UvrD-helicase domain-containing protein [Neobacillus paridis]MBL4953044.1 UvrD-helicase domain-containing protein [Neobacillus paridis]
MIDANYSVLWFRSEITDNTYKVIENYLKNGIKVFFLSFDDSELILVNPFLKEANKNGLLMLSVVRYAQEWDDREFRSFDGKQIDSALLDYLDANSSFNKEQYLLEHQQEEQHYIVKAGAGTGKTTTMINRILFLKHMIPQLNMGSVVMITFTNEAAANMRKKLLEKLKGYYDLTKDKTYLEWMEEIGNMFIGTFHSFAKEFLSNEGQRLGFSKSMEIRSFKHEQRKLIEYYIDQFATANPIIYESFRYLPHYKLVKAFMGIMERINNKSISYESVLMLEYGYDNRGFHQMAAYVIENVTKDLVKKKNDEESLEISDLISRLGVVRSIPQEQLHLQIQYLFVDEFQDTDEAQVSFVAWLVSQYQSQLFAVGDIKQSIYRFRGADYTAFNQLKGYLETANQRYFEYSLRKNYRSEEMLIHQFNQLFRKWDGVIEHFHYDETDHLLAVLEDTVEEGLVTLPLETTNLRHVLQRLYKEDVAVLVRSNRQVLKMVEEIESQGFFCDAEISGSFYRCLPVREFYLLLRRFTHPKVAKDRYLFHQSSYGNNELSISEVFQSFTQEKPYVLDLLEERENWIFGGESFKSQSALPVLQQVIEQVKPHEVFRRRFYQHLRKQFPGEDMGMQKQEAVAKMKEYKVNLDRLIYLLKKEFGNFEASLYDLEQFLTIKMATDTIENEWKLHDEVSHRIKVMTVHKAKGLEFNYVLLPYTNSPFIKDGMTEILLIPEAGNWKIGYHINWQDQIVENTFYRDHVKNEQAETIAEEARLLYVALTRAKKGIIAQSTATMNPYSIQCWSNLLESGENLHV